MSQTTVVTSRDNPLIQRLRKLSQDPGAYRKLGEIWLEGDHLCSACLARGVPVAVAVIAATAIYISRDAVPSAPPPSSLGDRAPRMRW